MSKLSNAYLRLNIEQYKSIIKDTMIPLIDDFNEKLERGELI